MAKCFVTFALFAVCIPSVCAHMLVSSSVLWRKYTLLQMVEDCDVVVTGEVTSMVSVFRQCTQTDVTIAIDNVIKGDIGGDSSVTCVIIGGDAVNPATGEREVLTLTPEAKFEVGEDVMVFLRAKGDHIGLPYPDGHYYVVHSGYGKRPVKDDKAVFMYPATDDPEEGQAVEFPIDLAVKLGKAGEKDKAAAALLEDRIKALVRVDETGAISLSAALTDDIKRGAQAIIDRPKEAKTPK